jgi:NADPH2:quinone reductase
VIGFTAGEIPQVKVNRLLLNNISVVGVGWGAYWTRPARLPPGAVGRAAAAARGRAARPRARDDAPLEDASQALLELDERRAAGKVLLTTR